MKALLNIDYANYFVAVDGSLTCGLAGQQIHDYICDLTEKFASSGDYVAFLIDGHDENDMYHPEHKLFPPHNINGTEGRKLYGNLEEIYQDIKDQENVEYFDKTRYISLVFAQIFVYYIQQLMHTTKVLTWLSMKRELQVLTKKVMNGHLDTLQIP